MRFQFAKIEPGFQTTLSITCMNNSLLAPGSTLTLSVACPIPSAELEFALAHGLARYHPDARIAPIPFAHVANITFMVGAETLGARLR